MSAPIWLTLRLVFIGVLFMPAFGNILGHYLPQLIAEILTGIISITLAVIINDWLFQDNYGKQLVRNLKKSFKSNQRNRRRKSS